MTTVLPSQNNQCPHCGGFHQTTCPRIKAIEYAENGTVKRIEFHAPHPLTASTHPDWRPSWIAGKEVW